MSHPCNHFMFQPCNHFTQRELLFNLTMATDNNNTNQQIIVLMQQLQQKNEQLQQKDQQINELQYQAEQMNKMQRLISSISYPTDLFESHPIGIYIYMLHSIHSF